MAQPRDGHHFNESIVSCGRLPPDMKTIRWGMIGCGDVTERKSGPGFAKAASSELAAVMRRNGALAAD
jgi:hypothetical protein